MTPPTSWSPQQEAIFGWFKSGEGSLVVRARAGSGKTTSLIEGVRYAPEKRILLTAFNRRIAQELSNRVSNPHADVKTLHALGLHFIRRFWEDIQIDGSGERAERIAGEVCGDDVPDPILRFVVRLASLGKRIVPLAEESAPLIDLAYIHDCVPDPDWDEEGYGVEWVAERALRAMLLSVETRDRSIDFDDMLFLPIRKRWVRNWFDLVVIDEAQDMNPAQLLIADGACKGRMVVTGDDRQAIYSWRGADSAALDRLKQERKATELQLTVTYRCPARVVESAKRLVPDFTAAPDARPGEVLEIDFEAMLGAIQAGDFMLSRFNAPLITVCLLLLKRDKRATIQGRDIGTGLKRLVRKLSTGRARNSVPYFLERVTIWADREIRRAIASRARTSEQRVAQVQDRANMLYALAEEVASVRELERRIDRLFVESRQPRVICSSVHRAKGMEADRVFVLSDTLGPENVLEEANIQYVAITRTKYRLVWVYGMPSYGPEGSH